MGNKNQALQRKYTKSKMQGMKFSQEKQWDIVVGNAFNTGIQEKETIDEFLERGEITKCRYSGRGAKMKKSRYGTWKMDVPQEGILDTAKTTKTIRRARK